MELDIRNFFHRETGYKEEYDLEGEVKSDDFKLCHPFKLHAVFIKIENGIDVKITNMEAKMNLTCQKCLADYTFNMVVKNADRIFYIETPPHFDMEADQPEMFLVNFKSQRLDLNEMIRQEILLHFPTSRVCFNGCKGLCQRCGINLNEKECSCEVDTDPYNPFKKLLKL